VRSYLPKTYPLYKAYVKHAKTKEQNKALTRYLKQHKQKKTYKNG